LRFPTTSADLLRNCLSILFSDAGDTIATIAYRLGCGSDTVKRIRRAYRAGGINALRPIQPPGCPSRATPEFLYALKQAVATNPMSLGYGVSTGSASRLAVPLTQVTGVRFSADQLRRLLHQPGYSVHRPQHTLKGQRDAGAYGKVDQQLVPLKKKS
jgi:transposase